MKSSGYKNIENTEFRGYSYNQLALMQSMVLIRGEKVRGIKGTAGLQIAHKMDGGSNNKRHLPLSIEGVQWPQGAVGLTGVLSSHWDSLLMSTRNDAHLPVKAKILDIRSRSR